MESGERAYYEKRTSWITIPTNRQNAFQPKGIFLNMKKILIPMKKSTLLIILF